MMDKHTYLHGLAPVPDNSVDYIGPFYTFASYGDSEIFAPYGAPQQDPIRMLASIGIIAADRGDTELASQTRWIERNMPPGGAAHLALRTSSDYATLWPILYFLLLDPQADGGKDPRPSMPPDYWSDGLNLGLSRTGWGAGDSYFSYQLIYPNLDHRHSDDNHFSLFRKGEWLTMETAGYSDAFVTAPMHNNVSVQNDAPSGNDPWVQSAAQTGSAYVYAADGDGQVLAHSATSEYFYALGDSTAQHNTSHTGSTGVTHLSRSIVWLKPDHVVTYDRVETKNPGFKRVYLQTPLPPSINGSSARASTKGGQRLFFTSLLPQGAQLSADPTTQHTASGQPMLGRLHVDAPQTPVTARFLGVVQGADAGASADPATVVQSSAGTKFAGAVVKKVAVMFPVDVGSFSSVTFTAPPGTTRFLVTGLTPGAKYAVQTSSTNAGVDVTIGPGSDKTADEGGVLAF
jgi:hypothetical protein